MNEDVDVGLICMPNPLVPGSTEQKCHKCQKVVFASPASMDRVLDEVSRTGGKLFIICIECAMAARTVRDVIPPSEDQFKEIKEYLQRDAKKEGGENGGTT